MLARGTTRFDFFDCVALNRVLETGPNRPPHGKRSVKIARCCAEVFKLPENIEQCRRTS